MEALICTICRLEFDGPEILVVLPNCKHIYHFHCIAKWVTRRNTCPCCFVEFDDFLRFDYPSLSRLFSPNPSLFLNDDPNFEVTVQVEDQHSKGSSRIRGILKRSTSGILETSNNGGVKNKITSNKSWGSTIENLSGVDMHSTMEELEKFKIDHERKGTFEGKKSAQVSEFLKFKKDFEANRMKRVNGIPKFIINRATSAVEEEKSLPFSGSGDEK